MSARKILFLSFIYLSLVACLSLTVRVICSRPTLFRGHTGLILGVTASPDGKTLISMSLDKTIKLWDVATRKERATLQAGVASFSPDGQTLASTGWGDRTIRLWEVATGDERATLRGHTADVHTFAFSPDGKTLASGSKDKTVKLWDLATGEERTSLRGHTSAIERLAFSPDGKTLASGGWDCTKLWDVATGEVRATLPHEQKIGPWGAAECLAFSPDGKILALGDSVGWVTLWDVATGTKTATLDGHSEEMLTVAFSPDGKLLASLGYDTIYLWDVASGKQTAAWEQDYHLPRPRLFRYIRSFIDDHPSIADTFPSIIEARTNVARSVFFTPEGKLKALGYDSRDDTTMKMWQVALTPSKEK